MTYLCFEKIFIYTDLVSPEIHNEIIFLLKASQAVGLCTLTVN